MAIPVPLLHVTRTSWDAKRKESASIAHNKSTKSSKNWWPRSTPRTCPAAILTSLNEISCSAWFEITAEIDHASTMTQNVDGDERQQLLGSIYDSWWSMDVKHSIQLFTATSATPVNGQELTKWSFSSQMTQVWFVCKVDLDDFTSEKQQQETSVTGKLLENGKCSRCRLMSFCLKICETKSQRNNSR